MNRRPKPGEDEDDLLKLQQEFLKSSGNQSAAVTTKRPEKRKSESFDGDARDVVKMEVIETCGHPELPLKKSKFRGTEPDDNTADEAAPRETLEDLEKRLDEKDESVAAILTSIIERDTRHETCALPIMTTQAFPTAKSCDVLGVKVAQTAGNARKKKSLFAQQVEARGVQHFGVDPSRRTATLSVSDRKTHATAAPMKQQLTSLNTPPCLISGDGLSASNKQTEVEQIHHENLNKLAAMSEEEIKEEQKKLLDMIDPKLVAFIKKKKSVGEQSMTSQGCASNERAKDETFSVIKGRKIMEKRQSEEPVLELPIQPSNKWVHMDTAEKDKLEWLKDLPPPPSAQGAETGRPARFDFEGNVLAVNVDIPVNMGLHHHGDEPERAGYTLEEIFQLSRSSNLQQRTLALHTLARIISKAQSGELSDKVQSPIVPAILSGGVLMLLRWGLDDSVLSVVAASLDALHALMWNQLDQDSIDTMWVSWQGNVISALTPTATLEKDSRPAELDEENQEEETDADVARRDVVLALVNRMDILIRLRYILESMRPQADTVVKIMEILNRVAQHSSGIAYEITKCPRLMDKIFTNFLPTVWSARESLISCVYGVPVPAAVRLVRVLCQSGRNLASILVAKHNIKLLLLRYLSADSSELHLPLKEASNLQHESLALWRVLASYGLVSEAYFDLYTNVVTYTGKIESHWKTSILSSSSLNISHMKFDSYLVSVLEKMLFVAGNTKSKQESPESSLQPYEVNWSHVNSLVQPILTSCQQMLSDIGTHYPQQKHDFQLPTACLNFLASFYGLEGHQKDTDLVSSLSEIEQVCSDMIIPFLSSYGFRVLVEHLCTFSNLAATSAEADQTSPPNLPSHGVFVRPISTEPPKVEAAPCTSVVNEKSNHPINMPILSQQSPFAFLTAFFRLVLGISKRHKGMIVKVISPIVKDKDIQMYMKKACSSGSSSPFCTSIFTRAENLLQHFWLKACILEPCDDMAIAHRVSLNLLSRLGHGDEHLIHDLITCVVFNQEFLREGADLGVATEALANLSLSEVMYLKSATSEEISVSKSHLLQEVYKNLAKIRGHYLMAFGNMDKAVFDSRNLYENNTSLISSQMYKCAGESLMPKDWMYMPLIYVYNKTVQSVGASGATVSAQAVSMVTSVLQWTYALEIWRPAEINQISTTVRLSRVLCAFIAGNDLFLDRQVNQYLAGLLRVFSTQRLLDRLDFEEKIPGLTSFYDLYQEVLDHYEAVSFGDPVFGLFVLLPLQQKHSSMLRKALWGERKKMLRTLRVPLNELLVPLNAFLQPEENDHELLNLQLTSLTSGTVQPIWSPVLYLLAVHHVNRFLFTTALQMDTDSEVTQAVRDRMWTQVVQLEEKMQDVIFYKQSGIDKSRGLELYAELPPNRQRTFDYHKKRTSEKLCS